MANSHAEVHVTKLAAAERQLRAAIRIFFLDEDDLAVHTVGAAAYGLLKDLKAHRGREEAADAFLTSVFYAVRDYRRGTLPAYLSEDPATLAWIEHLAAKLPISADSEFTDVVASISREAAREFWNKRNATANFLKHADRDPQGHLSLNDLDNTDLLMQAASSYTDLTRDNLYPEGYVLWLYFCVTKGIAEDLSGGHQVFADQMASLGAEERIVYCSHLIERLRGKDG